MCSQRQVSACCANGRPCGRLYVGAGLLFAGMGGVVGGDDVDAALIHGGEQRLDGRSAA